VKCNYRFLFLLSLLLLICVPYAAAQGSATSATFAIGFGSVHTKASDLGIKYNSTINNYQDCTLDPLDGLCYNKTSLDGLFMGFGGDVLWSEHFGAGFNVNFMPAKRHYGEPGLNVRQTFYEFNGIWAPITGTGATLKLMGGIGGAKTAFTFNYDTSIHPQSESYGSANHFLLHGGVGVDIYISRIAFIRPQFDFRYIPNFTKQFGSDMTMGGMIWIGIRAGGR
jgi:hypothetical protein